MDLRNNICNTSTKLPNPSAITKTVAVPNRNKPSGIVPQACAVCKYQRRRCAPDCILAPYFPGDKPQDFLNAHKLFGVSNIVKILRKVPEEYKEDAMKSVIFEGNVRAINPVGGCYQLMLDLESEINIRKTERELFLRQLYYYRSKRYGVPNRNVYIPIQETEFVRDYTNGGIMDSPKTGSNNDDQDLFKLKSNVGIREEDIKPDDHQQSNQFSTNEMPKADDDLKNHAQVN